ncbi:MAG: SDR family oxidoreductase [Alphaproteobacteria bacterium]|nr:SDR family oxidoreductase [Alphaproteobacteria bacterium]
MTMAGGMPTNAALAAARWTILGGQGFVGQALVKRLQAVGATVTVPARQDTSWLQQDLGHVIYAIGRTADFRGRPHDTLEAHVGLLSQLLRDGRFDSLLYLSSTRVYQGVPQDREQGTETADLIVNPNSPDDLYNLSKLLGESLCLNDTRPDARQMVRVARLSNVYGRNLPASFLRSLIEAARADCPLTLQDHPQTRKDYIALADVVNLLPAIALNGGDRLYNVASGQATSHADVIAAIQRFWPNWSCQTDPSAPLRHYPTIDIARIRTAFNFHATPFEQGFLSLLASLMEG